MIITFGSINLDITFPVDHIPQPGETVLGKTFMMSAGGKGANQAVAASRAGMKTEMVGMVGDDSLTDGALAFIRDYDVGISALGKSDKPTGCASIWVDSSGENSIAVASGANLDVHSDQVPDDWLKDENWLLLQMEVSVEENWKLIKRAKEKGCKIILNVAPASFVPHDILSEIDILIVNEGEARSIADGLDLAESNVTRLPRRFAERFGHACILTMGGAGSLYFDEHGGWSTPAMPISPVDTTAAGDTFVGFFGASIAKGKPIDEALRIATIAAGLCCQKRGSQKAIPDIEEVLEKMDMLPASKRLTLNNISG